MLAPFSQHPVFFYYTEISKSPCNELHRSAMSPMSTVRSAHVSLPGNENFNERCRCRSNQLLQFHSIERSIISNSMANHYVISLQLIIYSLLLLKCPRTKIC